MKKLFIELRKIVKKDIDLSPLDNLSGDTISIAATIQYLDYVPIISKYLEKKGKKVLLKKGAFYESHVIGCNPSAFDKKADTLLLIADGKFHGLNNALKLDKELYVFNLMNLEKITSEDLEIYKKKIKAKKVKFLSLNNIGILVSLKVGQNFNSTKPLISKLSKKFPDKNFYIFETDRINTSEFDNFSDIEIWINTACYGLGIDDSRIVNLQDISEFLD
jgi:diphthamide biosynthesis enzyme Dph1/Dph2-like protein